MIARFTKEQEPVRVINVEDGYCDVYICINPREVEVEIENETASSNNGNAIRNILNMTTMNFGNIMQIYH